MEQRPNQSHSRHELPDSDWRDFLETIGPWWEKYGNWVMIVITVVVVGFVAWSFLSRRASQAHENAFADLATTTSPEGLGNVATTYDVPAVQALARLRQGDLYLHNAITAGGKSAQGKNAADAAAKKSGEFGDGAEVAEGADGAGGGKADAATDLASAAAAYQKVLKQAPHKVYRLNALLGLASVAETREKWDKARADYKQAIALAGEGYPAIAGQARRRMGLLDELAQPIAFAPEPPPSKKAEGAKAKPQGAKSKAEGGEANVKAEAGPAAGAPGRGSAKPSAKKPVQGPGSAGSASPAAPQSKAGTKTGASTSERSEPAAGDKPASGDQ